MGLDLCGSYRTQQNKIRADNIILPNTLVTHTDTDSADSTDGPSVSIRSFRNGPYRIRRVHTSYPQGPQDSRPNFEKFQNSGANE